MEYMKTVVVRFGKIALAVGMGLVNGVAFAAPASDPTGSGVCSLVSLLQGKWLFGFAILGIVGGGAALLFGGEVTDGLKKIATVVTVVGVILAAANVLRYLPFAATC